MDGTTATPRRPRPRKPFPKRVGDIHRPELEGARKLMRFQLGSDPKPSEAQLEEFVSYLRMGDPLADAVVATYRTMPAGRGRRMVEQALEHGIETVEDPPPPLVALFEQLDRVPIWVDPGRMNLGADVSHRVGASSELVLRNLSLMGGYLNGAAAKPLVFTGQLDRMASRRIVETSKFWIDVTKRDGMGRFEDGWKSAVRVRLMHAQVRAMLLASGKWDEEAWGHPLNQADMMGTTLEFAQFFLTGLRMLGHVITKPEREAVIHLWRYVGYLMGVDERILPTNEADSIRAAYLFVSTYGGADADTRALGTALHDVPRKRAGDDPVKQKLAELEMALRTGFTRYVLGEQAGDDLGLPRNKAKYAVMATVPLRLGTELLRMAIPGANDYLVRRGRRELARVFREESARTGADVTFTPVQELAR